MMILTFLVIYLFIYSTFAFVFWSFYVFEVSCLRIRIDEFYCTRGGMPRGINELLILQQDSFYHNLSEAELIRVQDYNFDHPGKFNCNSLLISDLLFTLRHYKGPGLTVPYRYLNFYQNKSISFSGYKLHLSYSQNTSGY